MINPQFSTNSEYLDNLLSQQASPDFGVPASTGFALANSTQAPDSLSVAAQQIAAYQSQQAQTQAQTVASAAAGPGGATPGDPVVGDAPIQKKPGGYNGLLGGFLKVLNDLGAPKRASDHIVRLGKQSGIPLPITMATAGLGATVGGLLGGKEGAGVGMALGEMGPGALAALDHMAHGDFKDAWQKSMHGKTMGQMIADEVRVLPDKSYVPGLGRFANPHQLLSGTADATLAIADDPTTYLGPIVKGFKAGAALEGAKPVEQIINNPGTERWATWAAGVDSPARIAKSAASAGADLPATTVREIAQAGTKDEVMQALLKGSTLTAPDGTSAMKAVPQFYKSEIFRQAQRVANWEGPSLSTPYMRAFTSLPRTVLDTSDADFATQARKYLELFMPKDQVETEFNKVLAAEHPEDQINVIKSNVWKRFQDAGLTDEQIKNIGSAGHYSGLMNDSPFVGVAGEGARPAFKDALQKAAVQGSFFDEGDIMDEAMKSSRVSLPGYRELKILDSLDGNGILAKLARPEAVVAKYTGQWRALQTLKPALALRIAMDEGMNYAARYGVHPLAWMDGMSNAWIRTLTDAGPDTLRNTVGSAMETVKNAIEKLPGYSGIPVEDSRNIPKAPDLITDPFDHMTADRVPKEAVRQAMDGKEAGVLKGMNSNKMPGALMDKMVTLNPTDPEYERAWLQYLNSEVRRDPLKFKMLESWQNPIDMIDIKDQWAQSEEGKMAASAIAANGKMNAAKAAGAMTPQQIADHALTELIGDPERGLKPIVPQSLRSDLYMRDLKLSDIKNIPLEDRPSIMGYAASSTDKPGLWSTLKEGMHHYSSLMLNNMVREPAWQNEYTKEFERLTKVATESGALGTEVAPEQLAHLASNTATNNIMKVIHNPLATTPFDIMTRSFIPFNKAYIQFFKRWGGVAAENPAFVRRLGMLTGVAQTEGWIHQDPNGNLVWNLPVGGDFVSHTLSLGLQRNEDLPFMAGPLKAFSKAAVPPMLPFSSSIMPGFSPIVSIPASLLTMARPSTTEMVNKVLGPGFGSLNQPGMGYMDRVMSQIAPTWTKRLSEAFLGDSGDNHFGTAYINALQYYASKGELDPPKQLPDEDPQAYQRRVREFYAGKESQIRGTTRLLHLGQAAESLFSPYTPMPNTASMQLPSELRQLRAQNGYELGTQKFLDKYGPTAEYQLTSTTKAVQKDESPSKEYQAWANKNQDLIKDYPNIAGFLAPRGQFNSYAYQEQLTGGTRKKLSPTEWIKNVAIREGDDEWYNNIKPAFDALEQAGVSTQNLAPLIEAKKQELDSKYPGWLDWRNGAAAREQDRMSAVNELQTALADPRTAKMKEVRPLQQFMQAYTTMKSLVASQGFQTFNAKAPIVTTAKKILQAKYEQMKNDTNPGPLDEAYRYLFRYEIEG